MSFDCKQTKWEKDENYYVNIHFNKFSFATIIFRRKLNKIGGICVFSLFECIMP